MSVVIVIPARYGSTRFPGKPLAPILGKTMLERTWLIAKAVKGVDSVCIATDNERIAQHAVDFGAQVQMTPSTCENGTERCLCALSLMSESPDIVFNFQGDAVLTPPAVIERLISALFANPEIEIATAATRLSVEALERLIEQKQAGQPGGTLVTFDGKGKALYFSKSIIPFVRNLEDYRNSQAKLLPVFRHIGLYGYRFNALKKLACLPISPLEKVEGLEQLRALENGMHIQVVEVDYNGRTHWSVDSPEDAQLVEKIILAEGELLAFA